MLETERSDLLVHLATPYNHLHQARLSELKVRTVPARLKQRRQFASFLVHPPRTWCAGYFCNAMEA